MIDFIVATLVILTHLGALSFLSSAPRPRQVRTARPIVLARYGQAITRR